MSRLLDTYLVKHNPNQSSFVDSINLTLIRSDIPNTRVILIDDEILETKRKDNTLLYKVDCTVGLSDTDVTSILESA